MSLCNGNIPNNHYPALHVDDVLTCCSVINTTETMYCMLSCANPESVCTMFIRLWFSPITKINTVYKSRWTNAPNFSFSTQTFKLYQQQHVAGWRCVTTGKRLFLLTTSEVDQNRFWKYRVSVWHLFLGRLTYSGNCMYHLLLRLVSLHSARKGHLFAPYVSPT